MAAPETQTPQEAPASKPTTTGVLRGLISAGFRFDRSQSDPLVAARNAIGALIPLSIAVGLGHPAQGVESTVGGLQTAFADRPGPYRLRLFRMLGTALAAGLTAGLATGLGHSTIASAILLAVLSFSAGLLLSAGPSAAQVGVAATVAALVLGHIPQTPLHALYTGLLVVAGGVVQTLFAIAAWPLRRHGPERRALAALYRDVAALARTPPEAGSRPPVLTSLDDARAVITGVGHDHGPSVEAYRVLLDEADRSRRDVLVLASQIRRLGSEGKTESEAAARAALADAAQVFAEVADALDSDKLFDKATAARCRDLVKSMRAHALALGDSVTEHAVAGRIRSLAGKLRAILETATTGAAEGRTSEDEEERTGFRLRDPMATVRANLDLRSSALRHATRLGVLVPLTDILTRVEGINRGYWVSLTILVVLRPDFGGTFQRAFMRIAGTLIGLLLTSLVVHYLLGENKAALIVYMGAMFFLVRWSGPKNVGVTAIALAGLVVALLAIAGQPTSATVGPRAVDTIVGGAIALAAMLLWPSWERSEVTDRLAEVIEAYRRYLVALTAPETTGKSRSEARKAARLARSNAMASIDRVSAEPVDPHGMAELGDAVLSHSHRLIHALMAIDATREAGEIYAKAREFREIVDAARRSLDEFAAALRENRQAKRIAPLRPLHVALADRLRAAPEIAGGLATADALIEATDRLTNSIDSLTDLLVRRRASAVEQPVHQAG